MASRIIGFTSLLDSMSVLLSPAISGKLSQMIHECMGMFEFQYKLHLQKQQYAELAHELEFSVPHSQHQGSMKGEIVHLHSFLEF